MPAVRLMASKTEETPQKEEMLEMEGPETLPESPLLGLSDGAVRELVRSAKKRGYVTHDQIKSVLPSEEVNSEQIEDVLAMFREMGVNFVEAQETSKDGADPSEEGEESREEAERMSFLIAASDRSSGGVSRPSFSGISSFCSVSSVLLAMSLTAGTESAPDRDPLA